VIRAVAKSVGLAGLAVLLIWLVVTTSFTAYLARTDPAAALRLEPDHPVALVTLAEQRLIAGDITAARDMAETALRSHPLNADALSLLGQIYDINGDRARASPFMAAAARQSLHDSIAVHWTMRERLEARDIPAALQLADALFRSRPDLIVSIAPEIGPLAQDATTRRQLIALLATDPPWRTPFLARLCLVLPDARTMLDILLDLAGTSAPPSRAEVNVYLDFLIARGFAGFAYYAWLQFLPADQLAAAGLLFNGAFQEMPSGSPFDWRISLGVGAMSEFIAHPDQSALGALTLTFGPGRVELGDIAQIVVLPAGDYHLRGRENVQLTGRRGLHWRVLCSDGAIIGSMTPTIDTGRDWQRFDLGFTIPAAVCPFQIVRLAFDPRRPSERTVSGTAVYTAMEIVRDREP
jgi:hypothetical protein